MATNAFTHYNRIMSQLKQKISTAVKNKSETSADVFSFSAAGITMGIMLFSGQIKTDFINSALGVDLTVFSLAICILFAIFRLLRNQRVNAPRVAIILVALYLTCIPAIFWTTWSGYALEKVTRMYGITFIVTLLPVFLFKNIRDLDKFLNSIMLVAAAVVVLAILNLQSSTDPLFRLTTESSSTNGLALASAAGLVISFSRIFECKLRIAWLPASFACLCLWGLISAGSRSELLGGLLGITFIILSRRDPRSWGIIAPALLLLIIGLFQYTMKTGPEGSTSRISQMFSSSLAPGTLIEDSDRPKIWKSALSKLIISPLGIGWGGFEEVYMSSMSIDVIRIFPHNIVIEAALEGGWLCGGALVVVMALASKPLMRFINGDKVRPNGAFAGMLVVTGMSSMTSGEWNDCRLLFCMLSVGLLLNKYSHQIPTTDRNATTEQQALGNN